MNTATSELSVSSKGTTTTITLYLPLTWKLYMLPISVATARHPWEVGPQMNKFEQVSSDHHQMSLLGDKSPGVNWGSISTM